MLRSSICLLVFFLFSSTAQALSIDSIYGIKSFHFPSSPNNIHQVSTRITNYELTTNRLGQSLYQYCYRNGSTYVVWGMGFAENGDQLSEWRVNSSTDYASDFYQCLVRSVSITQINDTSLDVSFDDSFYSLLYDAILVPYANVSLVETYMGLIKINKNDFSLDISFLSIRPLDPTDLTNFEYLPKRFSFFQSTGSTPDLIVKDLSHFSGTGERLEVIDIISGLVEAVTSIQLFSLADLEATFLWNNLSLAEMAVAEPSIKIDKGGVSDNFPSDYSHGPGIGSSEGFSTAEVKNTQVDRSGNLYIFTEHRHQTTNCYESGDEGEACDINALASKEIYKLDSETGAPSFFLDGPNITMQLGGEPSGYDETDNAAVFSSSFSSGDLVGFRLQGFIIEDNRIFIIGARLNYLEGYYDSEAEHEIPPSLSSSLPSVLAFNLSGDLDNSFVEQIGLSALPTQITKLSNGDYLFLADSQIMHLSSFGIEQSSAITLPMTATHFVAHSEDNVQVFGLGLTDNLVQMKINTGLPILDTTPDNPSLIQVGDIDILADTDGVNFLYRSRSNAFTIAGLSSVSVPAYVIRGEISINGQAFTEELVSVKNGDVIILQQSIGYGNDSLIEIESIALDGYNSYVYVTALVMGGGLSDEGRNSRSIGAKSIVSSWEVDSDVYATAQLAAVNSGSVDTSLLIAGTAAAAAYANANAALSSIGGMGLVDKQFFAVLFFLFLFYTYKTRK